MLSKIWQILTGFLALLAGSLYVKNKLQENEIDEKDKQIDIKNQQIDAEKSKTETLKEQNKVKDKINKLYQTVGSVKKDNSNENKVKNTKDNKDYKVTL